MTIKEALKFSSKLKRSTSPHLDAEVLLSYVLNKSKSFLFTYPEKKLSKKQEKSFLKVIDHRSNGMPVAYLTGTKSFFGLDFIVNKYVLIPRPRTEHLVEKTLSVIGNGKNLRIADIGTGSGAIIISLAKKLGRGHKYFGIDISDKALKVAQQNTRKHKVAVKFIRSNLLTSVHQDFDIILANLPYLEKETDSSTKFEPKLALVAKEKGLRLHKELLQQIGRSSQTLQSVLLEADPNQKNQLQKLAQKYCPLTQTQMFIITE